MGIKDAIIVRRSVNENIVLYSYDIVNARSCSRHLGELKLFIIFIRNDRSRSMFDELNLHFARKITNVDS